MRNILSIFEIVQHNGHSHIFDLYEHNNYERNNFFFIDYAR